MSNKLSLVVRCAKAPAKNYHFIFKTYADDGSEFFRRRSNLEWIEEVDRPVRIDISSNWLTDVDLCPLESCNDLEYLSIAVNKLTSIDLTPLQHCTRLKHIDLSHNMLTDIDLTPLAGCKSLETLYLQENVFTEVNIAPLLDLKNLTTAVIQLTRRGTRPRLVIDSFMSNVPPHLNDPLFSFYRGRKAGFVPEWLYEKNTEIEYSPKPYRNLVDEYGWSGVKTHLVALSKKLRIGVEFNAQMFLLDALEMSELACFDGRLRDIVKLLPTSGSYDEGVHQLYSDIVKLLEKQLKRGGSTLYFDTDALSTTPGGVLLPAVLSRRAEEMQRIVLLERSGEVDLFPLWLTSYGNKILTALGFKRYIASSQLDLIYDALRDINHSITVEKVEYNAQEPKENSTGHVIQSYIRQTVAA